MYYYFFTVVVTLRRDGSIIGISRLIHLFRIKGAKTEPGSFYNYTISIWIALMGVSNGGEQRCTLEMAIVLY